MSKPQAPLLPKPTPASTTDTATHLKRIAANSLIVLNSRDFSHQTPMGQEVLSHISTTYSAQLDNYPGVLSWKQLNDVWREWYAQDERLAFVMRECSAFVDEEKGEANVYMDMTVVGLSNVELKGLTELRWWKEGDGVWRVRELWASRAMHGNDGGFV